MNPMRMIMLCLTVLLLPISMIVLAFKYGIEATDKWTREE